MTAAKDAYKVAQEMIAEVKAVGSTVLNFNIKKTRALTTLPPEIRELPNITTLDLGNTKTTDNGLAHIAGMTGITTLDLGNTKITDSGFVHIAGMTDITTLDLGNTKITDSGLVHIAGMTSIATLYLDNTQISNLHPLRALSKLVTDPDSLASPSTTPPQRAAIPASPKSPKSTI